MSDLRMVEGRESWSMEMETWSWGKQPACIYMWLVNAQLLTTSWAESMVERLVGRNKLLLDGEPDPRHSSRLQESRAYAFV